MRLVIVRDDIVENVIVWDGQTGWEPPEGATAHAFLDGAVSPGWPWNNGTPTDPNPPPEPEPYTGPIEVSRLRLKLELAERELLDDVDAAVVLAGAVAALYWAEATTFESNHPLSLAIGQAVGLSGEQVRDLFQAAAEREA